MEKIVIPGRVKISGEIDAISSKSDLHRLIICACLSGSRVRIKYSSELSSDINATIDCMTALGAKIDVQSGVITIREPINFESIPDSPVLDCRESGSTARFLLPLASFIGKGITLTGRGKLPERPFRDLCESLERAGAVFSSHNIPITVEAPINPDFDGCFEISGNVSSQYLSALLFILPVCRAKGIKLTTPLESAGYADMTLGAIGRFGAQIVEKDGVYTCLKGYGKPEGDICAEGDWSNAAFWLCAACGDGEISVRGLSEGSSQPDRAVIDILESMGAGLCAKDGCVKISAGERLRGTEIDAKNIPDLVPVLCVRAAVADGVTHITNVSRLRIKESDRIEAVSELLKNLGGRIETTDNDIWITGIQKLRGGKVDSFNDHRIAMSAAIAASFSDGDVEISDFRAVEKSYPLFFEHFKALSGEKELKIYE